MLVFLQFCVQMMSFWSRRSSLHLSLAGERLVVLPQPGHEAPPWPLCQYEFPADEFGVEM